GPIWEVVASGVPGSIGSGGRYDHLIEQLGGADTPATGGSRGGERVLLLRPGGGAGGGRLHGAGGGVAGGGARGGPVRGGARAATARAAGLRSSVYLGGSGKLGRQLRWASDQGARWCLIYGSTEDEAGTVTVRDMRSGEQTAVPVGELGGYLARVAG